MLYARLSGGDGSWFLTEYLAPDELPHFFQFLHTKPIRHEDEDDSARTDADAELSKYFDKGIEIILGRIHEAEYIFRQLSGDHGDERCEGDLQSGSKEIRIPPLNESSPEKEIEEKPIHDRPYRERHRHPLHPVERYEEWEKGDMDHLAHERDEKRCPRILQGEECSREERYQTLRKE